MTFLAETIQQNLQLWEECYQHPFVKAVCEQRMQEAMFLHYLKEDTKYLKDYARVLGMGIFKSSTMEEIVLFFDMLKFVEACESAARVEMLQAAGYAVAQIEQELKEEGTKAYTTFLIQTAKEEGVLSILFATLPCMLSYAYIGKRLAKEYPALLVDSPYSAWIQEYAGQVYHAKCEAWMQATEVLCEHVGWEERQHLQALFHTACQHELDFWNMCYEHKKG